MATREWSQIKEIFYGALALSPEAREPYLARACGENEGLRAQVRDLIAEDSRDQPLLDSPLSDRLFRLLRSGTAEDLCGRRLGAYRVIRPLGLGGESTVFLGERDDGQYHQQVAVKVLDGSRGGAVPPAGGAPGRLERQILAKLNHPAIARLFDAGTTGSGQPYFVMELVEGQPLDTYCRSRGLSLDRRIRLFLEVCAAVQHAHQSLVVHGDLKPGNILVTAHGHPKLLDFGIARMQISAIFSEGSPVRRGALTPAYASPEQRRGETLTAASDVYSLGVILYLLLAGVLPRGRTAPQEAPGAPPPPPSLAAAVGEGHPSTGSEGQVRDGGDGPAPARQPDGETGARVPVTAPDPGPGRGEGRRGNAGRDGPEAVRERVAGRWIRRLRGDLDAIVLRSLAPQASDRYPSVAELAADLRRFLENRPVAARRATWLYRGRRWLRRRWATAAVLALGLLALAGLGFQQWRLGQTLSLARQEQARAAAVTEFLDRLLAAGGPNAGIAGEVTVREVLDQASRALTFDLAHQPEVQAQLLETVGRTYRTLGQLERAGEALEAALRLRRSTAGDLHEDTAAGLGHLADLRLHQGRLDEAERMHREALEVRRRLHGPKHLAVAESLNNLGEVHRDRGEMEVAQELLGRAAELRRRLVGREHRAYLESLFELAILYQDQGDTERAVAHYRQALPLARRLLGELHLETLQITHDLAYLLRSSEERPFAETLYRQAAEGYRKVLGEEHPWTATATRNLSRLLREQGRFDEAEALLRESLEQQRKRSPQGDVHRAYAEEGVGRLLLAAGEPDGAEPYLRQALDQLRHHLVPGDWRIANSQSVLGECLTRLGRLDEAERHLQEALPALERKFGPDGARTETARRRLAEAQRRAVGG